MSRFGWVRRALMGALLVGALAACGSGGDSDSDDPSDGSTPDGGGATSGSDLTKPGSELELGQTAKLAWSPNQRIDTEIGLTVTALDDTSFKKSFEGWKLDKRTKSRAPYFIRATVTNASDEQVKGGFDVPLYGLDQADNLIQATKFDSDFSDCQPATLPRRFEPGDSVDTCLVILVPDKGDLIGATFRPTEKADPITWTGPVEKFHPSPDAEEDQQGDR